MLSSCLKVWTGLVEAVSTAIIISSGKIICRSLAFQSYLISIHRICVKLGVNCDHALHGVYSATKNFFKIPSKQVYMA